MAVFLEDNELDGAYHADLKHSKDFQKNFDEIERLSDNKVRGNIQPNYPKVNDGTLASQLPEMAMRRFQELFPGHFSVKGAPAWLNIILDEIWKESILPGATRDADFFTKYWLMVLDTHKFGAAASFSFFNAQKKCADFTRIYLRDLIFESGKVSPTSANYMWAHFYFTKLDLLRIIKGAEREEDYAKANNVQSFNTWDIELLKDFYDRGPTGKDKDQQNPTEKDKEVGGLYKMAGLFHKGVEAPFLTTLPSMENKVVRRRTNENPTGDIPINVIYAIQNLENAYGQGLVERAAPTQNVLDIYTQADVLATMIGIEPPTKISGDRSELQEKSLVFAPRAKWRIGNASVESHDTSSSVYTQLSTRMSAQKSNVLNHLGSFDSSIPAAAGNPQFSRTPRGINSLDTRGNTIDNFYIGQLRKGYARQAEILMNIHLANMKGTKDIELAKATIRRLEKAGWDIGTTSSIRIDYSEMNDIEAVFTPDDPNKANDPEKEALLEGIKLITEHPEAIQAMAAQGVEVKTGKLFQRYLQKLDIEDLDEIVVVNEEGPTDQTSQADPATMIPQIMQQYGVSENDAMVILKALQTGVSPEEIAAELTRRGYGS